MTGTVRARPAVPVNASARRYHDSIMAKESQPRRRTGGRSARVQRAVLDATTTVLREVGPDNMAIADVAARAGVHETTIYRRWGSRENLIVAALLDNSSTTIPLPDTGSVRGDLIAVARAVADMLSQPDGAALARMAASSIDAATAAARHEFWEGRFSMLSAIVERGIARDELDPSIDARLLLTAVIAPLHMYATVIDQPITEDLPARLVDLALAGATAR